MEPRNGQPASEELGQADIQVFVDAAPDDVWDAITTDEGLAPWLGEGAAIEARPGGDLSAPDPVTERPREGLVHTVQGQHELGFLWWPADDPTERSDVSIRVVPTGPGTLVQITEIQCAPARLATKPLSMHCSTVARADWAWRGTVLALSRSLVVA